MIALIKRYRRVLIVLMFPYLYLLMVLTVPTNQAVTAPGGINEVGTAIMIEDVVMSNNFNTVFVFSFHPLTPFQSWVLENDETMNVYQMTQRQRDLSWPEQNKQGMISKKSSLYLSVIKAFDLASQSDSSITIDYQYGGLYLYYRPSSNTDLEIGDVIVAINDHNHQNYSHNEFLLIVQQELLNSSQENPVNLKIQRISNEETTYHTIDYVYDKNQPRLLFHPRFIINSSSPSITMPGIHGVIGGPSGGLMQALSIYASLLNINTGDVVITGTGTIELSGEIGRIGGIPQKVFSAIDNNADIFFIPRSQSHTVPQINSELIIVPVETFSEAVTWLREHFNE